LSRSFSGNREYLIVQLIRLFEQFVASDRLEIPSMFHQDPLRRRILISLNIDLVVQHLIRHVSERNQERIEPVFDEETPIGSTRAMRTWYTTKPCQPTRKSQISHLVVDSAWEAHAANVLEGKDGANVVAYAKNDHLGFQVYYLWGGARRRYVPDFLIRFANGKTLILEIKGQDTEQDRAKRSALEVWVKGVNAKGGFGTWCCDVAFEPAQMQDIIQRHGAG